MKRQITMLAMTGAMLLLGAPAALATHPEPPPANGSAAPNTQDCRPGGNSHVVGAWNMMTQAEYELVLLAGRGVNADDALPEHLIHPGGADGTIDTWGELAHEAATATWAFCDHNTDGYACVMRQTLPTDANGSENWFIILDNHPFPS